MVEQRDVPPNGWNEWSKYVLKELERLNACYEKLDGKIGSLQVKVAGVAAAASIVTTLMFLLMSQYLKK